jgi:transcriptional regulator with XRE-family HTH domain
MGRIFSVRGGPRTNTKLAEHIGSKLLELRQQHLVTMAVLRGKTGLSTSYICQVENGQSMPSVETLWKIARAFGVNLDFFVEGYDDKDVT